MTVSVDMPDNTRHLATTLDGVVATTTGRIEAPPPSRQDLRSLARPSTEHRSHLGSEPQLLSPSTWGRQSRSSGLLTVGLPVSLGGRMTTTTSFRTSRSFYLTLPELGLSTFRRHKSTTGKTWSGSSEGTSRACTFAQGTPRTFEDADRSMMKAFAITFTGF
jgi:hypothetical protein